MWFPFSCQIKIIVDPEGPISVRFFLGSVLFRAPPEGPSTAQDRACSKRTLFKMTAQDRAYYTCAVEQSIDLL